MVVNIFKEEKEVEGNNFKDVNKDDWFYNAVSYAASEGLIAGYEDGTFRPM
ncbi:S-layer homology domain-containing protein [Acetivibrio saccincola]|nr:S-layer homology domain-containing protein [Acetivibrio saccincola]